MTRDPVAPSWVKRWLHEVVIAECNAPPQNKVKDLVFQVPRIATKWTDYCDWALKRNRDFSKICFYESDGDVFLNLVCGREP